MFFSWCSSILKRPQLHHQIDDDGKREQRFEKIHIFLLRNKSWREKVCTSYIRIFFLPIYPVYIFLFSHFSHLGCSVIRALE